MADLTLQAIGERLDFWAKLKGKNKTDDLVWRYITANFFRATPKARQKQVRKLEKQLIAQFSVEFVPQAVQTGRTVAGRFINRLAERGEVNPLTSRRARAAILRRHNLAVRDQLTAFRHAIRREANHKLAELEAFFEEGGALGRTKTDIAGQLKDLHDREKKAVEKAQAAGKSPRSVRSFGARFTVAAKGIMRDTYRRTAQQAEFNEFQQNNLGKEGFVWVAANGSEACPDCTALHGVMYPANKWPHTPGDGSTVCGASCMCSLIPQEYVQGNASLAAPLQYKKPVELDNGDIAQLNNNRVDITSTDDKVLETEKAKQPGAPK